MTQIKSSEFVGTARKGVWGTDASGMESEKPVSITKTVVRCIFAIVGYADLKKRTKMCANTTTNVQEKACATRVDQEVTLKSYLECASRFLV